MRCPLCQSKSKVIDSRLREKNVVWRKRECQECGERWDTYELDLLDIADVEELQKVIDEIQAFAQRVKKLYEQKLDLIEALTN